MSDDLASKMFSALVGEVPTEKKGIPTAERKRFLKKNIDSMSMDSKYEIGRVLVQRGRASALNVCGEGTVINLDSLPDDVIEQMHELMVFKLESQWKTYCEKHTV